MSETTQTSQSLYQALWNSADVLRSKMDANDYKSYLLGMVFYKYLSDKMLFFVAETMEEETESLEEALAVYRKYYEDEETHEDLLAVITDEMSYAIHPDLTFTALVERVNDGSFQLEDLAQASVILSRVTSFMKIFLKILTSTLRNLGRLLKSKTKRLRLWWKSCLS